ncbi:hypothetical protein RND71_016355 [Anisodus tanguticus]|uniref:Uncharacterized protein n=1 Tax=Anisodus tanguticus TaxID=243964 RepID=A0AAE1S8R1_9SOLA|nr:hypothetical protein RND71_016355 [Anisodus tanguticus]
MIADTNEFLNWFRARIFKLSTEGRANDELISLAVGPALKLKMKHYWMKFINKRKLNLILCTNDRENDLQVSLHRNDVEPQSINYNHTSTQAQTSAHNEEDDFINDKYIDASEGEDSKEELLDDNDGDDSDTSS